MIGKQLTRKYMSQEVCYKRTENSFIINNTTKQMKCLWFLVSLRNARLQAVLLLPASDLLMERLIER